MLGISQIAVNMNKMDAINYEQEEYDKVKVELEKLLKNIGYKTEGIQFVPCSGYAGDNLTKKSPNMPWYTGPTLLEAFDTLQVPPKPTDKPLRLPSRTSSRSPATARCRSAGWRAGSSSQTTASSSCPRA